MNKNAEIIAVGSELLLGQICNTNAQFLSKELAQLGINVYFHTVVGDNADRLKRAIEIAKKRSNLIIFTGGLGPTKDDLTKETIASILGKKLVMDEEALFSIKEYFQKTKRVMTENNKKQALVLEGSHVLPNDYGMAPGMVVEEAGYTYMLLPGPPKELQPMFLSYGKLSLASKVDVSEHIISRVLRFFGIGESQLETEIESLIDSQTNPTIAPLAGDHEVTLRITAKHQSIDKANELLNNTEKDILSIVGEFHYGYNDDTIFSVLFQKLKQLNVSISSAESLTGGMFGEEITQFSGASSIFDGAVVCYTNEVKEKVLGVSSNVLSEYGAVSEQCASSLANGIKSLMNTDIGISFTGVAGPSDLEGKPVGTVYIGMSLPDGKTIVKQLNIPGTREGIRIRTVKYGCFYLLKELMHRNA
ncbi:competence/damage-inducible protein A [Sutcliffiella cohnii]